MPREGSRHHHSSRRGYASVRDDGLRSWMWPKRWLVLKDQTLTFHRNEVQTPRIDQLELFSCIYDG